MAETPSPLFLLVLTTIGSALFSVFSLNGNPVVLFAIPVGVLAGMLYEEQTGLLVGVGGALLAGLVLFDLAKWEIIALALSAGIAAYLAARLSTQKSPLELGFYTVIGILLFDMLHTISSGRTILFRPEMIGGSAPESGARILSGIGIALFLAAYWLPEKKESSQ